MHMWSKREKTEVQAWMEIPAWALHSMAESSHRQEKLKEAKWMYEQALVGYEIALGPAHISTLDTVNNLGNLYKDQGKLAEAEKMYERALAGYEKALGPEHTSTLDSVHCFAILYADQGKLAKAEKIYERALAGREKALGPEHPSTLGTGSRAGCVWFRLRYAEEVSDEALEALSTYSLIQWKEEQAGYSMHKLVPAWGFDRLEVEEQGRYSRGNLAFLKSATQVGQLDPVKKSRITPHISSSVARLREWHKGSVEVPERSLDVICSLADFVRGTGQYYTEYELRASDEAERAQRKEQDEKGWLRSLSDLAAVLRYQGKYEAAETMNRQALEGYKKVLGKEHPSTLTSVYCLAYLLHQKADFAAAVPLYERACSGYVVRLGPSHPTTTQCVSHMSSLKSLMSSGKSSNE
nr:hypothetical protein B0A51_04161 [Rachicladosporium sp. CCFEE 5018]